MWTIIINYTFASLILPWSGIPHNSCMCVRLCLFWFLVYKTFCCIADFKALVCCTAITQLSPTFKKRYCFKLLYYDFFKTSINKYMAVMKRIVIFLKVPGALETSVQSGTEMETTTEVQL